MASLKARESTPPPVVARAGRYTVFLTPKPPEAPPTPRSPLSNPPTPRSPPPPLSPPKPAPPVQVPPPQFDDPKAKRAGVFGFFWDALARVQHAHSSFDEFLADWFGLDQSKYQWALNDYLEAKGNEKEGTKQKEAAGKLQNV